ncbi:MAG TPA: D-alanyl-D-alanine carboxypeptidase family protein [Burkholderiaceae bacterium]|nr:D-alanyl-D-alanine carboxypeptidase family protein [Burkholderiaceae bacterium]
MKKWILGLGASLLVASRAFALSIPAPALDANAWLLLDAKSNEIIAEHNADARIQPASLTKIMTAYLVFKAIHDHQLSMDQTVTVSTLAWKVDPESSKMFLKPGDRVTIRQLLTGLLVDSGNDAAVALAEATAGSVGTFVAEMNQMAAHMGLKSTHFASPHGLPSPETYSTARDLSELARHLIQDYPKLYVGFDTIKQYTYDKITQQNRNKLLWIDPSVDGLKTGHTAEAGYCLIASAHRPGATVDRRLISVVLGTPSSKARVQESETLLNWGFGNFDTVKLYGKQQVVATPRVWKGEQDQVKVGFTHDVYLTVGRGAKLLGVPKVTTKGPLVAPIAADAQVASLTETVGDRTVTLPLVALHPVGQAGFFGRAWDTVALWVSRKMG